MNKQIFDRFTASLELLKTSLQQWNDDLERRELNAKSNLDEIIKQRRELIAKQNTIMTQVNGMRLDRENADKKLLEAKKLKDASTAEFEKAEGLVSSTRIQGEDLTVRERKMTLLEKHDIEVTQKEQDLLTQQESLNEAKRLLKKSQELADEKHQALNIREKHLAIEEAKYRRLNATI